MTTSPETSGFVFWFTGLPAAGKTTLAGHLARHLRKRGLSVVLLDGDVLRRGVNADLGFTPAERRENIRRTAEIAALLAQSGIVVVVALISPYEQDRRRARAIVGAERFMEIHVRADVQTCRRRDPKGLYARAEKGEIRGLTGVDAPYETPSAPDLVIDTARNSLSDCIRELCTQSVHRLLARAAN